MTFNKVRGWFASDQGMVQGFLIGLGGESFFAAVRRGANLFFFTTGHHFYNRKPRNKYILLYSTLYSTTSILLQKSLNLTPIQGFLGRWLLAALLRYFAFSSPGSHPTFLFQMEHLALRGQTFQSVWLCKAKHSGMFGLAKPNAPSGIKMWDGYQGSRMRSSVVAPLGVTSPKNLELE